MLTRYQGFTIISSLILCVIVAGLTSLGVWQLSRMYEKQEQLASIDATSSEDVMMFTEFVDTIGFKKLASGTRVQVDTLVDRRKVWLLDNQIFDKKVGYKVLANIVTPKGMVLTDFGWVEAEQNREQFPNIALPEAVRGETALVTYASNNAFVDSSFVETKQVGDALVSRIQAINSEDEVVLFLTAPSQIFERFWHPVVMPPEKHLGYAIQWFGLAIAASVIGFLRLKK